MKCPPLLLMLLLMVSYLENFAQTTGQNAEIDRYALKAPQMIFEDIDSLAAYFRARANTDYEKARSIYVWITHNIEYDSEAYRNGNRRINRSNTDVLRRRKAVCFGYATLFKSLGETMQLEVELISGYSKGTQTSTTKLEEPDHAWNAVKIDNEWYLLDATLGSGTLKKDQTFLRTVSNEYFLVPPKSFILRHLPQDPMWQLLDCPISMEQFKADNFTLQQSPTSIEPCFNYRDSIQEFRSLSIAAQKIKRARNAVDFYPTKEMKQELASVYIDQAGLLSDELERLDLVKDHKKIKALQSEIIRLIKEAIPLAKLQGWQWELYISTLINQAVLIYNDSPVTESEDVLKQAIEYLEEAQRSLIHSTNTFFKSRASSQCENYLQILKEQLKR